MYELWKNPVEILPRDEGIFSFAPEPVSANPPYQKRNFVFTLKIDNNSEKYDKVFGYETAPALPSEDANEMYENVLQLEDIYVPFEK